MRFLQRFYMSIALLALLAACGSASEQSAAGGTLGTRTPRATVQPGSASDPTQVAAAPTPFGAEPTAVVDRPAPILGFTPQSGAPGTQVEVFGSGYLPGQPIVLRIGLPQPVGEALTSVIPDEQGSWSTTVVMPDRLPSGERITATQVYLVVMDDSNQALASAPFTFTPSQPLEEAHAAAQALVEQVMQHYTSDMAAVDALLTSDRRAQVASGRPLNDVLGLLQMPVNDYIVHPALDRPADAVFIPVDVQYNDGSTGQTLISVALENQQWRVAGAEAVPGDSSNDWPGAEWHTLTSGDFNGDGANDVVFYTATSVQPSASFNDDFLQANAQAIESLMIVDGYGPLAKNWLSIAPQGIIAADTPLISFSGDGNLPGPTAFLVALDPGSSSLINLLPLAGDGTAHGEVLRFNWSADAGGYRLIPIPAR